MIEVEHFLLMIMIIKIKERVYRFVSRMNCIVLNPIHQNALSILDIMACYGDRKAMSGVLESSRAALSNRSILLLHSHHPNDSAIHQSINNSSPPHPIKKIRPPLESCHCALSICTIIKA